MAQVLGWRVAPANPENPREKQVWGREDEFVLVTHRVWWTLGVHGGVIHLGVGPAGGPFVGEGTCGWSAGVGMEPKQTAAWLPEDPGAKHPEGEKSRKAALKGEKDGISDGQ